MNQTAIKPKSHDVADILFYATSRKDVIGVLERQYGTETRLLDEIEQLKISIETAQREYQLLKKYGSK